jgi:hypothetical protein
MLLRTAWSLLCVLSLFPQATALVRPSPQFHDADTNLKAGEVRFDPFQSIDWQQLAQRDMKEFNLDHPTPEQVTNLKKQLREHPLDETGTSSEVHFASPLDPGMSRGFYYLLSNAGLAPLQLLHLAGTMRFALNDQKTAIRPDVFYGQVVAKLAAPPMQDGAFVVYSDTSLAFTSLGGTRFTAQKVGKQNAYVYEREGKKWTLTVQDEGLFDVLSASFFKIGESEYVYVKWKPDTENNYGGCERQFSLFALEQELKLVASSRSGCDV